MVTILVATPRDAHSEEEWSLTSPVAVGLAFLTNVALHESGHHLIADGVGARDATLQFFSQENGAFFLGLSTATDVPEDSILTYKLGGEIASSYTFELALQSYRRRPTAYNSALLFFSGTDFFWYTIFAFYLAPQEDPRYDPVGIREVTGFGRGTILGAATAQLLTNVTRVVSGRDVVIPSFSYDRQSASMNFTLRY